MFHLVKISSGANQLRPVRLQCACNVAGDFPSLEHAKVFAHRHLGRLTGIAHGRVEVAPELIPQPAEVFLEPEVTKKNEEEVKETVGDA